MEFEKPLSYNFASLTLPMKWSCSKLRDSWPKQLLSWDGPIVQSSFKRLSTLSVAPHPSAKCWKHFVLPFKTEQWLPSMPRSVAPFTACYNTWSTSLKKIYFIYYNIIILTTFYYLWILSQRLWATSNATFNTYRKTKFLLHSMHFFFWPLEFWGTQAWWIINSSFPKWFVVVLSLLYHTYWCSSMEKKKVQYSELSDCCDSIHFLIVHIISNPNALGIHMVKSNALLSMSLRVPTVPGLKDH